MPALTVVTSPSIEDSPQKPLSTRAQSYVTDSTRSGSPTGSPTESPNDSTRTSSPLSQEQFDPPSRKKESQPSDILRAKLEALAIVEEDVELSQRFSDAVRLGKSNVPCRQMVMRMIRMLRLCDYEAEVIVMVLAVALVHLDSIFCATDARMEDTERVSIAVLQCFNAHCYVMDEACPMKYWQSNIYSTYCNVKVLNSAAFKLLKILKFKLQVSEEAVTAKRRYLEATA